jgi:hypothetical protein
MNSTLTGLASSLLLNAGLTSAAEKLDPIRNRGCQSSGGTVPVISAEQCIFPCAFTPEVGQ